MIEKLKNKFKSMSKLEWLVFGLWISVAVWLITLIGILVGLGNSAGDKIDDKDNIKYTVSRTYPIEAGTEKKPDLAKYVPIPTNFLEVDKTDTPTDIYTKAANIKPTTTFTLAVAVNRGKKEIVYSDATLDAAVEPAQTHADTAQALADATPTEANKKAAKDAQTHADTVKAASVNARTSYTVGLKDLDPSEKGIKDSNIMAAFGLVFVISLFSAIGGTVFAAVRSKGGKK